MDKLTAEDCLMSQRREERVRLSENNRFERTRVRHIFPSKRNEDSLSEKSKNVKSPVERIQANGLFEGFRSFDLNDRIVSQIQGCFDEKACLPMHKSLHENLGG